jgi:protoporphyrinogen oxidase
MIYDIIIIGGGIAGLNTCYQLLKKNNKLSILVLEKNKTLGGRIQTFRKKINNIEYHWEEGAGRFNKNHLLLFDLINELGLSKDIIPIGSHITFKPSEGNYSKKFLNKSPFDFIQKIIYHSKKDSLETLQQYTFEEYALTIVKKDEMKFILDSFGYYAQLVRMNAYNAIKLFGAGMNPNLPFYSMKNGLDQIIEKMKENIEKQGGKLGMKKNVNNIIYDEENNIFTIQLDNHIAYKSRKCVLAIPKPNLLKLHILKKYNHLLNSIYFKSLCRIYSVFKKEDIWFKDIGKITTNNNSRYIIPINTETGSIMISYSDSKFADYWNKLDQLKDKKRLIQKLKENIMKSIGIKIADPIFTKVFYWYCAIGFWKKKKNSKILSKKIIQPNKRISLFICGENYSETQGWIEGALETSNQVVSTIMNERICDK